MRCKICDYRLWNIASRSCPECGEPFKPSEHQFKPNGVKFCCVHCGQDYYGTGENGHLQPTQFNCAQCGQHIHMDEMVLLPAGAESKATVELNPWTQRGSFGGYSGGSGGFEGSGGSGGVGFWYGFTRTIGRGMVRPSQLIDATPQSSPARSAWWFMFMVIMVQQLFGGVLLILMPMMIAMSAGGGRGTPWSVVVIMLLILVVVPAVSLAIVSGLWIISSQVVLRWNNPDGPPMGRTAHAMLYSAGPMIIGAVPCLGFYLMPVGLVWWMVSAVLMLSRLPNVSTDRATAAVLVLPVAVVGLSIVVIAVVMGVLGTVDTSVMAVPAPPVVAPSPLP